MTDAHAGNIPRNETRSALGRRGLRATADAGERGQPGSEVSGQKGHSQVAEEEQDTSGRQILARQPGDSGVAVGVPA